MSSVRLRRLQSDHVRLVAYTKRQPRLRLVQAEGQPPEKYQLEYHLKSLRQVDGQLQVIGRHVVEITLPREYPRTPPQCRMLTPIFHPNIAPHAICIGDHWGPGEPLWAIVARIGEMISYQSYNIKSPLNGEAARWVEQNLDRLPLDPVPLYVEESEREPADAPESPPPPTEFPVIHRRPPAAAIQVQQVGPTPPAASSATPRGDSRETVAKMVVQCPKCGKRYRYGANAVGKRLRCGECQTVIPIPPEPR